MAHKIHITVLSMILLLFVWPIGEGFPALVTVDTSNNSGDLPSVLRSGLMGSWSDNFIPLTSEITSENKKPFWRLHLGIGWDESLVKPADFDIKFQNWLKNTIDPNIKKYQDAGYQTVISLTQVPKWLSFFPSDECMPSGDGCWKKWQYSPPRNYAEWKKLIQLLVTTQKQDGIKADYIIWDEPNWMFYGTEEQYLEMYKYSVEAIKEIDSSIKVGALGVGCWYCEKYENCPAQITGLADGACPVSDSMIKEQIRYVSANNIPMDFIDWHFPDLGSFKQEVDATRNWLTTYGLATTLPLTIGEWVFSPKNEDEATEKGAANTIYTLKTFIDNGIYRHSATSIYDQPGWKSGDWANVGFFSSDGVIRTKWNAFRVLDKLSGLRLKADTTGDVTALASKDTNNNISIVMANASALQPVTFELKNIASGTYTLRKYIIDGDMTTIHSNPCRYNKKTEAAQSTSECGVNGAIDQAVVKAKDDSANVVFSYLLSAGIPQQYVNNLSACYHNSACNVSSYVQSTCQKNPVQCAKQKSTITEAQNLYSNLFYHGAYTVSGGKAYSISAGIDQINRLKEVSLEGSKEEKQISVTNGAYTEDISMLPYSVVLIEILK